MNGLTPAAALKVGAVVEVAHPRHDGAMIEFEILGVENSTPLPGTIRWFYRHSFAEDLAEMTYLDIGAQTMVKVVKFHDLPKEAALPARRP